MAILSNTTKYSSLREWMQEDSALDPSEHPLIRLGALYHLDDHNDEDAVIKKVQILLRSVVQDKELYASNTDFLFSLHAAVYLANKNEFEGITWILRTLVDLPDDQKKIAQIALGSCYRFPLAPILSLVLDMSIKKKDLSSLEELTEYSEDDLIEWGQKSQSEQQELFQKIITRMDAIKKLSRRPGLELGLGVILKRPVIQDIGFAHTGFISFFGTDKKNRMLPYEPSIVLNKNNPFLRQSIWQMQAYAGRRVIIIYEKDEPFKIKYAYILPFALMSSAEQESHLIDLFMDGYGAELSVVHSKWGADKKERYRLISASGNTSVRAFMAKKQGLGNIFILHPDNNQPLSTKYSLKEESVLKVIGSFIKNTTLDLAINAARPASTKRVFNLVLSTKGDHWKLLGENFPSKALLAIEQAPWGLSPFVLVDEYSSLDRMSIMSNFFSTSPDNYGVAACNIKGRDGHPLVRIIKADGKTLLRPVDKEVLPGTPVFLRKWIDENAGDGKEHDEIIFLERFALAGACKSCFGIGFEICPTCQGEASTICKICKGTGEVPCSACAGTQRCTICGGTGRYYDTGNVCVKCRGTGLCKYCQKRRGKIHCKETGCEYGRIKCPTCSGNRTIECKCGGKKQGKFLEL